jgi:hypothetical protein
MAKRKPTESMTTEQLAEKAIRDIEQMSEQEKALVRFYLHKAFGSLKIRKMIDKDSPRREHTN